MEGGNVEVDQTPLQNQIKKNKECKYQQCPLHTVPVPVATRTDTSSQGSGAGARALFGQVGAGARPTAPAPT